MMSREQLHGEQQMPGISSRMFEISSFSLFMVMVIQDEMSFSERSDVDMKKKSFSKRPLSSYGGTSSASNSLCLFSLVSFPHSVFFKELYPMFSVSLLNNITKVVQTKFVDECVRVEVGSRIEPINLFKKLQGLSTVLPPVSTVSTSPHSPVVLKEIPGSSCFPRGKRDLKKVVVSNESKVLCPLSINFPDLWNYFFVQDDGEDETFLVISSCKEANFCFESVLGEKCEGFQKKNRNGIPIPRNAVTLFDFFFKKEIIEMRKQEGFLSKFIIPFGGKRDHVFVCYWSQCFLKFEKWENVFPFINSEKTSKEKSKIILNLEAFLMKEEFCNIRKNYDFSKEKQGNLENKISSVCNNISYHFWSLKMWRIMKMTVFFKIDLNGQLVLINVTQIVAKEGQPQKPESSRAKTNR